MKKFFAGLKYIKRHGFVFSYYKLRQKLFERRLDYEAWYAAHKASSETLAAQRAASFPRMPLFSIVVPVCNTPRDFLHSMIKSVLAQSYAKFELCIADGSEGDAVFAVLQKYAATDNRLKIMRLKKNLGIAENTNAALETAVGDYIVLLDHDDMLSPDALYEIAAATNQSAVPPDIVYSDEDKTDATGEKHFAPHFKPAFSPALLETHNYICHVTSVRRDFLLRHSIKFRGGFDGAQDYDFILRCAEKTDRITHVPRVLYHWRLHAASTAGGNAKSYTHDAGRRALAEHLARTQKRGEVTGSRTANFYRVKYEPPAKEKLSVAVFGKNADAFFAALPPSDKIIYEKIAAESLAEAVAKSAGERIIFADASARIKRGDRAWTEELAAESATGGADIVGAKIYDEAGVLYPVGLLVAADGKTIACYGGKKKRDVGYMQRLFARRDFDAVNPCLMLCSRKVFAAAKGINLGGDWRDALLRISLAASAKKMRIVFTPYVEAVVPRAPKISPQESEYRADGPYNPNYEFLSIYFSRE